MLYQLLKSNYLTEKILCFSDNNEIKFGRNYCEDRLLIVSPKKLMKKYGKNVDVVIASSAYDKIRDQLLSYGYEDNQIHLFNFAFMNIQYTDRDFIYDHIKDFERAYARMGDAKSRKIFASILNYRITKDEKFLEEMQADVDDEHYQYFDNKLFDFKDDEIFLDIGAYVGDTLTVYNEVYENWKGYIGFEADRMIFERLNKCIDILGVHSKCRTYNYAAWDCKDTLYFNENPGSSSMKQVADSDSEGVHAEQIDTLLTRDEPVTFIKMDIEGAEYQALCGMKELIKENHPLIAVCVYHLRDDFYHLTDLIDEILPGVYSFYFRQYRYTPTETVCYAIPDNRCKTYN